MFDFMRNVVGAIFPVSYDSLSDADKITAIAALSQTMAAVLSVLALLLSLWVFSRQQKLARWQLRLHREDHIIEWSRACVGLLAEIEETATSHRVNSVELLPPKEYVQYRARLSALIDEGRLYFPNVQSWTHGRHKQGAYQGHRQEILDPLVAFYDRMKIVQYDPAEVATEEKFTALNVIRREFVTAAQAAIDPRRFNQIRA